MYWLDKRLNTHWPVGYLYGSVQLHALQPMPSEDPSTRGARLRGTLAAANLFQLHELAAHVTDQIKNHISSATVIDYCRSGNANRSGIEQMVRQHLRNLPRWKPAVREHEHHA